MDSEHTFNAPLHVMRHWLFIILQVCTHTYHPPSHKPPHRWVKMIWRIADHLHQAECQSLGPRGPCLGRTPMEVQFPVLQTNNKRWIRTMMKYAVSSTWGQHTTKKKMKEKKFDSAHNVGHSMLYACLYALARVCVREYTCASRGPIRLCSLFLCCEEVNEKTSTTQRKQ